MGFKIAFMSFVIMAVMAGGFYFYYKDTQERMATLHENNAKLGSAVQTQKAAIKSMENNFNKQALIFKLTSYFVLFITLPPPFLFP